MSWFRNMPLVTYLATLSALIFAGTAVADSNSYDLEINSTLEVKSPGQPKPQPLVATTRLQYRLDRQDQADQVVINQLEVKIASEGRSLMNSRMNPKGASFQQGPKDETKITTEDASPALKKLLEQFGKPLALVTRDGEGAEVSRELLVDKDSSLVENGVIDNTQIFHVRFPAGLDVWESKVKLSMGNGQFAQGSLKYRKIENTPNGQILVDVSGDLKAEGKLPLGDINSGKYHVTGTQTYDPGHKIWTAGVLNLDVTLNMESNNQEAGSATGLMKIVLTIPPVTPEATPEPSATQPEDKVTTEDPVKP